MTAVLQSDCKKIIDSLRFFSNDELDAILNDDTKIENLIVSLDQSYLENIKEDKKRVTVTINQLSEANLKREPDLADSRLAVLQLSEEGANLSKNVEEKYQILREKK